MNKQYKQNIDRPFIQKVLQGDRQSRITLNTVLHPIISQQSNLFCKKYCFDQRYQFRCTLPQPLSGADKTAPLCEWGNASYEWMLTDLSKIKRLESFDDRNNSGFEAYARVIARSIPFFERWKDWRFNNNVYVPQYIQAMHPKSSVIFRGLKAQRTVADIAQQSGLSESEAESVCQQILRELTSRNRLHLLLPTEQVSYDEQEGEDNYAVHTHNLHSEAFDIAQDEDFQQVKASFEQLGETEQFILESFYLEDLSAKQVLKMLEQRNIHHIKDVQQLYYARRKALSALITHYHTQETLS